MDWRTSTYMGSSWEMEVRLRLLGGHQGPLGHRRLADAAADGAVIRV